MIISFLPIRLSFLLALATIIPIKKIGNLVSVMIYVVAPLNGTEHIRRNAVKRILRAGVAPSAIILKYGAKIYSRNIALMYQLKSRP